MSDEFKRLKQYDRGEWFQVPKDFIRSFKLGTALFLAGLINAYRMSLKDSEDEWAIVTNKRLLKEGFSKKNIETHMKALIRMKIVKIQRKGVPPKRWIFIDIDVLEMEISKTPKLGLLNTPKTGSTVTPKTGSSTLHINKNLSKNSSGKWDRFAQRLHKAILSCQTVRKNSRVNTWGQHFRKLHEIDGISITDIKRHLKWYCRMLETEGDHTKNGNPHYLPHTFCGKAFRDDFDTLISQKNQYDHKMGNNATNENDSSPKVKTRVITKEEENELEGLSVEELEEKGIYDRDY